MDPSTDPLATMNVQMDGTVDSHGMTVRELCEAYHKWKNWVSDPHKVCDRVIAELTRRCSPPTVGPGEVEAAWESLYPKIVQVAVNSACLAGPESCGPAWDALKAELARLLSRPRPDARVPADVYTAAKIANGRWQPEKFDPPHDFKKCKCAVCITITMAHFVLSLPPADKGYDAGFAAGIEAAVKAADSFEDAEPDDEGYPPYSARDIAYEIRRIMPPGADRDARKGAVT